MKSSQNHFII